mgnify:CR=1 FL=1
MTISANSAPLKHRLTEAIFAEVRSLLEQKRLLLKSGTIVDATIIDAPPSTKNAEKSRDPEMKHGKKNSREWRFGMKAHVGTDRRAIVRDRPTSRRCTSCSGGDGHLQHAVSLMREQVVSSLDIVELVAVRDH